jgi:hypothetical protein
VLAAAFLLVSLYFVYRSFYGMRIQSAAAAEAVPARKAVQAA